MREASFPSPIKTVPARSTISMSRFSVRAASAIRRMSKVSEVAATRKAVLSRQRRAATTISTRSGSCIKTAGLSSMLTDTKSSTENASHKGNNSCAPRWLDSDSNSHSTMPAKKAPSANDTLSSTTVLAHDSAISRPGPCPAWVARFICTTMPKTAMRLTARSFLSEKSSAALNISGVMPISDNCEGPQGWGARN